MTDFTVQLAGVSKQFAQKSVLNNLSLHIRHSEFLTLLGPSGCGKTTLLRIISGSEHPDEGTVVIDGVEVTQTPPERRPVHRVFQNYALFPHMTVFDNVAFGLRCKKVEKKEIKQRVSDILRTVKLEEYAHHKPHQLSGGQQQRVAIARAVVNKPIVLLLDEPLSALDYDLRKNMQIELKELQRTLNMTFILVTHDQEEALSMSDRIAVMNKGKIEQIGSARDIYENPANPYVAHFIGNANIFYTHVMAARNDQLSVCLEGKAFEFENKNNYHTHQKVAIVVRPEDMQIDHSHSHTYNALPGTLYQAIYKGSTVDLIVHLPSGHCITVTEFFNENDHTVEYKKGDTIAVYWQRGREVILNAQ